MTSLGKRLGSHDFGLADWLILIAGIWLIVSPFALAYSDIQAALAADLTIGVILVALTAFSAIRHAVGAFMPEYEDVGVSTTLSAILVPTGTVLILAPFIFGYSPLIGNLIVNEIVIGSFVVLVSVISTINHAMIATDMSRTREEETREKLHRAA